jgi:hypothetical protein
MRMAMVTAYSHVQRLADAGLVTRVYDREGSLVVITPTGRIRTGTARGDPPRGATRGPGLWHSRAVSWVAALLSLRERRWLSERELRLRDEWQVPVYWPASRGTHRPDLGAEVDARRVAIEVELSPKAPRRLRAILAGYEAAIAERQLAGVLYVCDRDDVLAGVRRAAAHAGLPPERLRARTLPDLQREVRGLARDRLRRDSSPVPGS